MGSALGVVVVNSSFGAVDRFGRSMGLQTVSASCRRSAFIGPAGRRREALFSAGLARSLTQWGSALLKHKGGGMVAASRDSRLNWFALGPAALGVVGVGEAFEGTNERASQ